MPYSWEHDLVTPLRISQYAKKVWGQRVRVDRLLPSTTDQNPKASQWRLPLWARASCINHFPFIHLDWCYVKPLSFYLLVIVLCSVGFRNLSFTTSSYLVDSKLPKYIISTGYLPVFLVSW